MVGLHYYTNFLLSSLANKIIDVSVCDILAYYNSFSTKVKKMITLFYSSILKMYKLIINNIKLGTLLFALGYETCNQEPQNQTNWPSVLR